MLESRAVDRVKAGSPKQRLFERLTAMKQRRDEVTGSNAFTAARDAGLVPEPSAPSPEQVATAERHLADCKQGMDVARQRVEDIADGTLQFTGIPKHQDTQIRSALSAVSLSSARIKVAEVLLKSERRRLAATMTASLVVLDRVAVAAYQS